ncbi:MAG: putative porin [Bacteroidota bacterium]
MFLPLAILWVVNGELFSQRPNFGGSGSGGVGGMGSSGGSGGGQREIEPDTFPMFYHFPGEKNKMYAFVDSNLTNDFHQHDPARKEKFDYFNLGFPGSPAYPIYFKPIQRKGFDLGIHSFDLYLLTAEKVPAYTLKRAFTQATFYQTGEQNDGFFGIQFSRNFANGINFSIDYERLNQIGSSTHFSNQKGRTSSLGLNFWIKPPKGRYESYLIIAQNGILQRENGGIIKLPDPGADFFSLSLATVQLKNGASELKHNESAIRQYFTILPRKPMPVVVDSASRVKNDSLLPPPRSNIAIQPDTSNGEYLRLFHNLSWKSSKYLFYDDLLTDFNIENYYKSFFTDPRGLRNSIQVNTLDNSLYVQTQVGKKWRFDVSAGLSQQLHFLKLEPGDSTVHNLALDGSFSLKYSEKLSLSGKANLQLLDNRGDYYLSGEMKLGLGNLGDILVSGMNQLAGPDLMQKQFFVSQRQIWDNDFKKSLTTQLAGELSLKKIRSNVGLTLTLIDNAVFYNVDGKPAQLDAPLSIIQSSIKQQFNAGKFSWEGVLVFQLANRTDVLSLPQLWTRHTLSLNTRLFKVLESRLGAEFRFFTPFSTYYYFPLTAQFQLSNSFPASPYPLMDVFASFKITKFRIFLKFEDVAGTFLQTRYAQVYRYYLPTGGLRFGFKWRFLQ